MNATVAQRLAAVARLLEHRLWLGVVVLYGVGYAVSFAALELDFFAAPSPAALVGLVPAFYAITSCSAGFWRTRRRVRTERLMRQLPTDVAIHQQDDGSASGTIHLGDGGLVAISIPADIATVLDDNHELILPYIFGEVVPDDVKAQLGLPSMAEVRTAVERAEDDASDY